MLLAETAYQLLHGFFFGSIYNYDTAYTIIMYFFGRFSDIYPIYPIVHYVNMSMQYRSISIFAVVKMTSFRLKIVIFLLVLLKTKIAGTR